MIKRTLLSIAAACTVLAISPLVAAQQVTMKFSHEAPESAIKGRSARMLADLVEKYTAGSVKVNVFPGGQLIPTTEELRAAIRGQVDIIAPYSSYYASLDQTWDIFYQPMLFRSVQQGMDVFAGKTGKELLGRLESKGLIGLSIWHDGPVYAFTTGAPADVPETLKGVKVRVAPSKPIEAMLGKIGATSISMPATEVYLALQQGVVQAVVTTPTYAAPAKWGEVLKTMTRNMWGVGGYGLAINSGTWAKLNASQKQAFLKAVKETEEWNVKETLKNIEASEAALARSGLKIIDVTEDQRKAWVSLAEPVWQSQSPEIKRLIDAIRK